MDRRGKEREACTFSRNHGGTCSNLANHKPSRSGDALIAVSIKDYGGVPVGGMTGPGLGLRLHSGLLRQARLVLQVTALLAI